MKMTNDIYDPYTYEGIISTEKSSEWTRDELDAQMRLALNPEVMALTTVIPTQMLREQFLDFGDANRQAFSYRCSDINVLDLMQCNSLISQEQRREVETQVETRQAAARATALETSALRVSEAHRAQMPKLRAAITKIGKKLPAAALELPGYVKTIDTISEAVEDSKTVDDYMQLYDACKTIKRMWKSIPVKRH